MCWKHKTKMAQFYCWIISFNVGWYRAALVCPSIVANLALSCNSIFLMSPLHDLLLMIKWHLIRKNRALFVKIPIGTFFFEIFEKKRFLSIMKDFQFFSKKPIGKILALFDVFSATLWGGRGLDYGKNDWKKWNFDSSTMGKISWKNEKKVNFLDW